MEIQDHINYRRIAEAIDYISTNFTEQPDLYTIAGEVNLSPLYFQKLFTQWAGVSPKKFLQFLTVEYAKSKLRSGHETLSETAFASGLSGTGRLHDLFITIEGMTPGEYKSGAGSLKINYSFETSIFGEVLIASTTRGICWLAFVEDETFAFSQLQKEFPGACFINSTDRLHAPALRFFNKDWNEPEKIKLHLKGTEFQLKVWKALLSIAHGSLTTYGRVASHIELPAASRAVGTAIGSNPVAFLIPCHRVIQSTGIIGNYMWGHTRKKAIIGWEASVNHLETEQK